MSFTYDDTTWTPQTTKEHADNILAQVNETLQANNVTDSDGNVIQLSSSFANALYLLILACGSQFAENDTKLTAAINSFNIELCDDAQIDNLLPIAAISRNPGVYSTLNVVATASASGQCVIPAGAKLPFENVNFVTQTETIIAAGSSQTIYTICDTVGDYTVLTGEVTAFDQGYANLASVINEESSVPGKSAESTNELRQRLIKGDTIKYTLDGCKAALEELVGVNYARVYFNYNTDEEIDLPGGVTLAPRHAYIVIYGSNDNIASTYVEYMSAPTINAEGATSPKSQTYYTASGQAIDILYDEAEEQEVHIKIFLEEDSDYGTQVNNQLKRDLIASSASWNIGEDLNGVLVTKPFIDIDYASVAYVQISTDGETWVNHLEIGCNVLPRLLDENIEVELL